MKLYYLKLITASLSIGLSNGCMQNNNKADVVIVGNGIEIPIDGCVEANKKILGNAVDPTVFCKCLIPKLYAEYKNDPDRFKLLREGKFDKIAEAGVEKVAQFYAECMSRSATSDSNARLTITPRMEKTIRQGIKDSFAGTDFEKTNDLDAYCDCLISGMQTELTAREIIQGNNADSVKLNRLREKCAQSSRKR